MNPIVMVVSSVICARHPWDVDRKHIRRNGNRQLSNINLSDSGDRLLPPAVGAISISSPRSEH
jgi:hypothetical protein